MRPIIATAQHPHSAETTSRIVREVNPRALRTYSIKQTGHENC